ncbi:phospholipid-binding protein MlaC [Parasalinivibrio latis]|uniref:phospholipid-binding protein MlaC n=1 Tax=Parasalinivibrio latis TaxID=2952610 RepID=UPI0030E3C923
MKLLRHLVLASCLLVTGLAHAANGMAVDRSNPYELMNEVAKITFSRIKSEQTELQANPEQLRVVVEEELLPYVNVKYAAYKVLGRNLRGSTENEREVFLKAFQDYLVASYAQVMTQYTDQKLEIEKPKAIDPKRKVVAVGVDILDATRPTIHLEFKLRKNSKTGEWYAFDMVAEGVSLLDTKQSEWSGELAKNGIVPVAKQLEKLARQPLKTEAPK